MLETTEDTSLKGTGGITGLTLRADALGTGGITGLTFGVKLIGSTRVYTGAT